MNEVILAKDNPVIKRRWNRDTNTYAEGARDNKTKGMLCLVSSRVLRCDDCIKYQLGKCFELAISTEQVFGFLPWPILWGAPSLFRMPGGQRSIRKNW